MGEVRDWYVVLEAADQRVRDKEPGSSALEILRGDEQSAIEALENWAEDITRLGRVPDGLDWLNRSPAQIIRRVGKRAYRARVDCFEMETENGYSNGYAWLRVREAD